MDLKVNSSRSVTLSYILKVFANKQIDNYKSYRANKHQINMRYLGKIIHTANIGKKKPRL